MKKGMILRNDKGMILASENDHQRRFRPAGNYPRLPDEEIAGKKDGVKVRRKEAAREGCRPAGDAARESQ